MKVCVKKVDKKSHHLPPSAYVLPLCSSLNLISLPHLKGAAHPFSLISLHFFLITFACPYCIFPSFFLFSLLPTFPNFLQTSPPSHLPHLLPSAPPFHSLLPSPHLEGKLLLFADKKCEEGGDRIQTSHTMQNIPYLWKQVREER